MDPHAVLLIDDDPTFRDRLRRLLEEEFPGLAVGEADSACTGISSLGGSAWTAVVVDLSMPGKSGIEAIQEIRTLRPALPIVALSSFPRDPFAELTRAAGANAYVQKSEVSEQLAATLRRVVAAHPKT